MLSKLIELSRPQIFVRIFGAAFCGAFATLAFAPFSFWCAMPIALIGFLLFIHQQSAKKAALIGLSWGLGQFGTGIAWVHVVIEKFGGLPTSVGLVLISLLVLYLALFPALFAYVFRRINLPNTQGYLLLAPGLWLCVDWLRGWIFTGFPWLWAGYSQIDGPLAPIAPILGVQGITLCLVLISGAITLSITQRVYPPLALVVLILFTSVGLGNIHWTENTNQQLKVAMIQGNIPQELKWLPEYRWPTLLTYQDLTRANWDADIIIWPEAAIPAFENELPYFLERLDSVAKTNNSTIITGILDKTENGQYFNNVITLGKNGLDGYQYPAKEVYSKHHLLVFGEFVPFEEFLRPIAPLFNLPMSSFTRGDYNQPNINASGYQLATAICYEIAFNEQVRQSLNLDSDFILTLSNDTWFGRSIGPHQHLEIARMRALENGKPVLRATNTGLTAAIDHQGKIIKQIPQFETLVLRAKIFVTEGVTPYTKWGNYPLYLWILLSGIAMVWLHRRTNTR